MQSTQKEMQLSQLEAGHGVDPSTEDCNPKGVRGCGDHMSLRSSYLKIILYGMGAHLISVAYWVLSSLTTSFNADLGSFSLAVLYASHIGALILSPSLVNIMGSKACSILSGLSAFCFAASYFYPCWYTIMPSSLVMGFASSLMFTSLTVTKSDEVRRVVEKANLDEVTYHGRFGAIGAVACNSSAIVAGIITLATLSESSSQYASYYNATNLGENGSVFDNATALGLGMVPQACVTLSPSSSAASSDSVNYLVLVAVCSFATLLSVVIYSFSPGAAYHQCKLCSFGLKKALLDIATYSVTVVKQASTPAYGLFLPLCVLHGLISAFFFGVFTKMYITECVGVEYVGMSIVIWGLSSCMASFLSGWLIRYTPNYVIVMFVLGVCAIGSIVFLLAWERQPSLEVICVFAAISGLGHGAVFSAALVYTGIAPGSSQEIGNSLIFIGMGFGNALQFVLSEYVSAEVNLYILLTVTVLAVPMFAIADMHFGSGRSSRRGCCSKKTEEDETTVEEQTSEEDTKSTGTSASGDSTVTTNLSVSVNDSENDENGSRSVMWKESPV